MKILQSFSLAYLMLTTLIATGAMAEVITCPGDITLTSDQQITSYVNNYLNCSVIIGDLKLEGESQKSSNSITDLTPLKNIQTIIGKLSLTGIGSTSTHSGTLNGLEQLTSVGELLIAYNPNLTDILALSNLKQITSNHADITITNNSSLSVVALPKLENVDSLNIKSNDSLTIITDFNSLITAGAISIESNNSLDEISGFNQVVTIDKSLTVLNNPKLSQLSAFAQLESIHKTNFADDCESQLVSGLVIYQNESLSTLSGFQNLTYSDDIQFKNIHQAQFSQNSFANVSEVACNLWIQGTQLTELSPFKALKTVGGTFTLFNNNQLSQVKGMDTIESIGELQVTSNPLLKNFSGFAQVPINSIGKLTIFGNDALESLDGLQSITQLEAGFDIEANPTLSSLLGLDNLTELSQSLILDHNPVLGNLDNLSKLTQPTSITESRKQPFNNETDATLNRIQITNNPLLTSLSGLKNLHRTFYNLNISNNFFLPSLSGLENLHVLYGKAIVIENYNLAECKALCSIENNETKVTLHNYQGDCISKATLACNNNSSFYLN